MLKSSASCISMSQLGMQEQSWHLQDKRFPGCSQVES